MCQGLNYARMVELVFFLFVKKNVLCVASYPRRINNSWRKLGFSPDFGVKAC
jgi:hypothetical protein